jgi:glutamate synthase (NADPH/NADH) large chain
MIERHFKYTGSTRARNILDDWSRERAHFVKVFPTEYKRALGELWAEAQKQKATPEKIAA